MRSRRVVGLRLQYGYAMRIDINKVVRHTYSAHPTSIFYYYVAKKMKPEPCERYQTPPAPQLMKLVQKTCSIRLPNTKSANALCDYQHAIAYHHTARGA